MTHPVRVSLVFLFLSVGVASLSAQTSKAISEEGAGHPDRIPVPSESKGGRVLKLDLLDAMRLGMRRNVDLMAQRLVAPQTMQDVRIAKAFFEPELYASGRVQRTEQPLRNQFQPDLQQEIYEAQAGWRQRIATGGLLDFSFRNTRVEQTTTSTAQFPPKLHNLGLSLTLTQPLLRGAWSDYAMRDVRQNQARAAGARQDLLQARQSKLLEIIRAYWDLVFAREDYRVQFQALELAQRQLQITVERIRVGDLSRRDRVADEAEVARRKEALITSTNTIYDRSDDLRSLLFANDDRQMWEIDLEPSSPIEVDFAVTELSWRRCRENARRHRPELLSLGTAVTVAEVSLLTARRDLLPQLDLTGSYGPSGVRSRFGPAWDDAWALDFPDWSIELTFAIPIGNSAARGRAKQARLALEEAQARLSARELLVDKEVRAAARRLRTLSESVKAATESVRLSQSDLDTAREKTRVGELTLFDVQERNQQLQEARSRLLRNQLDFRIAMAELLFYQGLLDASAAPVDRLGPDGVPRGSDGAVDSTGQKPKTENPDKREPGVRDTVTEPDPATTR